MDNLGPGSVQKDAQDTARGLDWRIMRPSREPCLVHAAKRVGMWLRLKRDISGVLLGE